MEKDFFLNILRKVGILDNSVRSSFFLVILKKVPLNILVENILEEVKPKMVIFNVDEKLSQI